MVCGQVAPADRFVVGDSVAKEVQALTCDSPWVSSRSKTPEPSMLRQTAGVAPLRTANTRPLPESNDLRPLGPKPAKAEMSPRRLDEPPTPSGSIEQSESCFSLFGSFPCDLGP